MIGDLPTFCGGAALRTLAPGDRVFRARQTDSPGTAIDWFRASDDSELRAPAKPRASRTNAAGIRAFYGALQERIASAEVQPPLGTHVVVGVFVPTRPLTVLDLSGLGDVFSYFDLFDPEFNTASERLSFLRMLEQDVSRPPRFSDEPLAYVPTQVIAEYIRDVLRLDGLAYRSTQTGKAPSWGQLYGSPLDPAERNVVLLGAAARTTSEEPVEGSEPGLQFLPEFKQMVDITQIEVHHSPNPQAHYQAPPGE
ncbi:MAG: RES family NAD+ phosphorylase [Acidobacteria bacterium]|nr:RES family NAD+ phosphorylase [Acidobacteriota bacterium]